MFLLRGWCNIEVWGFVVEFGGLGCLWVFELMVGLLDWC